MICPNCRSENNPDSRFCGHCAEPLVETLPGETLSSGQKTGTESPSTNGPSIGGRYRIIEELGRGGMGTVFKVEDKEINEKIALKLLKPEISGNEEIIGRFRNEIKIARKINHKNVCRMYHLSKDKNSYFITMEYVSGEDLKNIIRMVGVLSPGKAILIAKQICEGLAEAHRMGVVHRDLKPPNIMIDREGNARIMDFGIARSIDAKGFTATGVMIGTPDYMSPEQAEGKDIDCRSDIYSLGIILFEMVTGKVPFIGDNPINVALKRKFEVPPAPREINPQVPEDLNRVILGCLERDKKKRFPSAEALLAELTKIETGLPSTSLFVPKRKSMATKEITVTFRVKRLLVPGLLFLSLCILAALRLLFVIKHPSQNSGRPAYSRQLTFKGNVHSAALSPDGKWIAYVSRLASGEQNVMIQDMETSQAVEAMRAETFRDLRWSPDSSTLSLWANSVEFGSGNFLIPRFGGKPRLLEISAQALAWSPDASRFACFRQAEKRINLVHKLTGETSSLPLTGNFFFLLDLDWSPVNNLILFLTAEKDQRSAIWIMTADGKNQHKIIEEDLPILSPRWSPQGNDVYYFISRGQTKDLEKISVSPKTGDSLKPRSLVLSGLQAAGGFSLGKDVPRLLVTRGFEHSNLWLVTADKAGAGLRLEKKPLTKGTFQNIHPSISPDGKYVAFARGGRTSANIYILPMAGGDPQQITFLDSFSDRPAWSPDGRRLAFASNEGGKFRVWKIGASGGSPYQFSRALMSADSIFLTWSPGAKILFQRPGNRNFHILDSETERETPLLQDDTAGWIFTPHTSPDGKKIAVHWNRLPTRGLWVVSLENSSQALIKKGYFWPIGWSDDGRGIYSFERTAGAVRILLVSADNGRDKILGDLPLDFERNAIGDIAVRGEQYVFAIYEINADVWLLENFDPDLN